MYSDAQIFLDYITTGRTFLTGISRINHYNLMSSVFCFGDKYKSEGIPRSIHNAFSKMMILNQTLCIQVFNSDDIILTNKLFGYFMRCITSLVSDMLVATLKVTDRFSSVLRAFNLASNRTLESSKFFLRIPKMLRWLKEFTIGSCNKVTNKAVT